MAAARQIEVEVPPIPLREADATLDAVKKRGTVICGVNGNRAGFSALDSQGRWRGMDVDTCKAIAAAVLGDSEKVQFVKTTTQTRFTALQTGEVDVLTRNVTWTLGRDAKLGIDFVAKPVTRAKLEPLVQQETTT